MNSVGDKSKEATAFLKSIMDADDADLGKAATKAEWQHSIIPTSQIISIAAQAEPCQKLPHSSTVKLAARRLHATMTNQPLADYDGDTPVEIRETICELLADTGIPYTKQLLADHMQANPKREQDKDSPNQPPAKKAAVYTPGLTVRPIAVTAEFTSITSARDRNMSESTNHGDDKEDNEDGENLDKVEEKQAKRKQRKLQPELLMQLPQVAGQSMPVETNADTHEVKTITKTSKLKAYQKFSLVQGLPPCNKACPVLDLLESGGYPQTKIATIRKMTGTYFKEKYKDLRQDANATMHILADTLFLVAAMRTEQQVTDEQLLGIERNVHIVAMLQSQKLLTYGEAIMTKIVEQLRLPDVGALRKVTGITDELTDAQQQQVLSQIKLMVEMNTVVRASTRAQGENDGAAETKDALPRPTVPTDATTATVAETANPLNDLRKKRTTAPPRETTEDPKCAQPSAASASSATSAPTLPARSEGGHQQLHRHQQHQQDQQHPEHVQRNGEKCSTWTSISRVDTSTVPESHPPATGRPERLSHWPTAIRMAVLKEYLCLHYI